MRSWRQLGVFVCVCGGGGGVFVCVYSGCSVVCKVVSPNAQ